MLYQASTTRLQSAQASPAKDIVIVSHECAGPAHSNKTCLFTAFKPEPVRSSIPSLSPSKSPSSILRSGFLFPFIPFVYLLFEALLKCLPSAFIPFHPLLCSYSNFISSQPPVRLNHAANGHTAHQQKDFKLDGEGAIDGREYVSGKGEAEEGKTPLF